MIAAFRFLDVESAAVGAASVLMFELFLVAIALIYVKRDQIKARFVCTQCVMETKKEE